MRPQNSNNKEITEYFNGSITEFIECEPCKSYKPGYLSHPLQGFRSERRHAKIHIYKPGTAWHD